jgi:hypothetical protein
MKKFLRWLRRVRNDRAIRKAISTHEGRLKLAYCMVDPIRGPHPRYPPRGCVGVSEEEPCPLP